MTASRVPPDITSLLVAWREGDKDALDRLVPLVYGELHRIAHLHMRGERRDQPLQTTALLNEAYLRLIDVSRVRWTDRAHFLAVSARTMRRVLVDAARERESLKRGGGMVRMELDETRLPVAARSVDLIALGDALDALAVLDARKASVVEMRFFGGLTVEETADALGVSADTVMRDWKMARLWLLRELRRDNGARDGPPVSSS